jgi:hypothetical protein
MDFPDHERLLSGRRSPLPETEARAEKEYRDYVAALREEYPGLARELSGFTGLAHVLDWIRRRGVDLRSIDLITQDEFSHDLLVPLTPGQFWLSFSMT